MISFAQFMVATSLIAFWVMVATARYINREWERILEQETIRYKVAYERAIELEKLAYPQHVVTNFDWR